MARCTFIKPGGERCRGVPVRGSTLCAAHHPDFQERRRAGARRGGKAQGSGELATIRAELATLYADTIAGRVDKGRAAVGAQIQNVRLRAVEVERKIREQEELEERISAMEEQVLDTGGYRAKWQR
jgi:hypothetical protein